MSPDSPSIPFDQTPEFKHFKDAMRLVLAVPKNELDKLLVREHNKSVRKKKEKQAKRHNDG